MARRVLLVEDSSMMRRMISAMLQDEGYDVGMAVDGVEGLAKAREFNPELILTDYEMPEMDGPTLCKALKADPDLRPIPVLMLTTLGATESKVLGLNAGADDYMQKPQSPQEVEEIFARIRAQLRIADLRKEIAERNRLLETMQAKLTLELNLARKVQLGLMPKPPRARGKIQIAVTYDSANALGGDVYDFAILDETRLGILMADISGHGCERGAAFGHGQDSRCASHERRRPSRRGTRRAGCRGRAILPRGLLLHRVLPADRRVHRHVRLRGGRPPSGDRGGAQRNPPAGVGPPDCSVSVLPPIPRPAPKRSSRASRSCFTTDGLPDAMNPADKAFSEVRIRELLEEHRDEEPGAILELLKAAVASHVDPGQAHDDINLILVRNLPQ